MNSREILNDSVPFVDSNKRFSPQLSGLGLIEGLYWATEPKKAESQLQRSLGSTNSFEHVALCDTGEPSFGLSVADEDNIVYEGFSPPAAWNVPYSIQRVRFGPGEKRDFTFHNGEEILIPIKGEITGHFYWSPGGRPPDRVLLQPPAAKGTILRINPQIPHHFWGSNDESSGWLILRHASDSPVALVTDAEAPAVAPRHRMRFQSRSKRKVPANTYTTLRRRITLEELQKPGAYALVAWGIAEFIRLARQKAGLTATDLAVHIGVDPSSLSRLEEAKTNVSIEMLGKVCRGLRIGIDQCMDSGNWLFETAEARSTRLSSGDALLTGAAPGHRLHPYLVHCAEGDKRTVSSLAGDDRNQTCSWIIFSGRALLEIPKQLGGRSIIAEAGNVIHFRTPAQIKVNALSDTAIVKIACSHWCDCRVAPSK